MKNDKTLNEVTHDSKLSRRDFIKHMSVAAAVVALSTACQDNDNNENEKGNTQMKSALLITSAQVDLLSSSGKAWGFTNESAVTNNVPNKLKMILTKAREARVPIIHSPVGFEFEKMAGYEPLSAIQSVIIDNQLLAIGTNGVNFIEEATPADNERVLPFRQGFSSFWAQSIQSHLQELGVTELYIAGMLAEGCIESHTKDAVENGYKPIVISDAIASTSMELLDASLKTLALHSSKLITAEEFLNS